MKFEKFIPLVKMEETPSGSLLVFGTVTAEEPDLESEVCDYAGTKPFYQAKVNSMFKLTSAVEGMEPSLMPMREMHQFKAIGAGRSIEFDDAAKTIKMGFEVVDPDAIIKFKKGVLIGFSQGGDYVGPMVDDPVHKGCKRYVADPAEVSGVDSPCLPSALVETMKGRTVTLAKASGAVEQILLQTPSPDILAFAKIERELAELRRMFKREFSDEERKKLAEEGKALPDGSFPIETVEDLKNAIHAYGRASNKEEAKKHIISRARALGRTDLLPDDWTSDKARKAIRMACAKISLQKGLYEVGWLASLVQDLHWLCLNAEFELEMEGDGSKVPGDLRDAWDALVEAFKDMAEEEADELAAQGGKGAKSMKITTAEQVAKAAKTIHDHLEKHMEMHKALHEKLEGTFHKEHAIMKAHTAMMDHCEKCMKAAKDAGMGDEPEPEEKDGEKAALSALTKQVADLTEIVKKLPANQTIPATGAGGAQKSVEFEDLLVSK